MNSEKNIGKYLQIHNIMICLKCIIDDTKQKKNKEVIKLTKFKKYYRYFIIALLFCSILTAVSFTQNTSVSAETFGATWDKSTIYVGYDDTYELEDQIDLSILIWNLEFDDYDIPLEFVKVDPSSPLVDIPITEVTYLGGPMGMGVPTISNNTITSAYIKI